MGAGPVDPLHLRLSPRNYVVLATLASAAMLAAAHAFERIGGYEPCPLCLRQREVYWVVLAAAAVGAVLMRLRPEVRRVVPALLAALFAAGAFIAAYHAGVELKLWPAPAGCGVGGGADAAGLDAILRGESVRIVPCDEAAWSLLGISMAGWNALVLLALTALGLGSARSPEGAARRG